MIRLPARGHETTAAPSPQAWAKLATATEMGHDRIDGGVDDHEDGGHDGMKNVMIMMMLMMSIETSES